MRKSAYHLAQVNIARLVAPLDASATHGFVENLDRINALAEAQPGFVWRLVGEGGNATDIAAFDDPMVLINMSVWRDIESLAAFVYRSGHREVMRRRAEWFHKMEAYLALWWVPIGRPPTPVEGRERVERLARLGPTAAAFTFRQPFSAPDALSPALPVLDRCA